MIVNANLVILAWTGSALTAHTVALTASLLLAGQILQAITVVPFYLALSHGQTGLVLRVQVFSVVVITPLLIFLIGRYGMVGGGISWLVMNLCTLLPYMYFLHRMFLRGELQAWAVRDVGRPLAAALAVVMAARWLLPEPSSRVMILAVLAVTWAAAAVASALAIPELRDAAISQARKAFRVSHAS